MEVDPVSVNASKFLESVETMRENVVDVPPAPTVKGSGEYPLRFQHLAMLPNGSTADVLRAVTGNWDKASMAKNPPKAGSDAASKLQGMYKKVHLVVCNPASVNQPVYKQKLLNPLTTNDSSMPMFTLTYSQVPAEFPDLMVGSRIEQRDIDEDKFSGYINIKIGVMRESIIQTAEWMLNEVTRNTALNKICPGVKYMLDPDIRNYGDKGVGILARLDRPDITGVEGNRVNPTYGGWGDHRPSLRRW